MAKLNFIMLHSEVFRVLVVTLHVTTVRRIPCPFSLGLFFHAGRPARLGFSALCTGISFLCAQMRDH